MFSKDMSQTSGSKTRFYESKQIKYEQTTVVLFLTRLLWPTYLPDSVEIKAVIIFK